MPPIEMPSTCARSIPSRVEQPERVGGQLARSRTGPSAGAESPIPRLSKLMQSKPSRSGARNGSPQESRVPPIPWISSNGAPSPARS